MSKAFGDMPYKYYITSWQWYDKRDYILKLGNYTCEKCLKSKEKYPRLILNVHHIHYNSLGNEGRHDLMILCSKCHKKEHGIKN